jgi:hypothetical protein
METFCRNVWDGVKIGTCICILGRLLSLLKNEEILQQITPPRRRMKYLWKVGENLYCSPNSLAVVVFYITDLWPQREQEKPITASMQPANESGKRGDSVITCRLAIDTTGCTSNKPNKLRCFQSASELYRLSHRRWSANFSANFCG